MRAISAVILGRAVAVEERVVWLQMVVAGWVFLGDQVRLALRIQPLF